MIGAAPTNMVDHHLTQFHDLCRQMRTEALHLVAAGRVSEDDMVEELRGQLSRTSQLVQCGDHR